MKSLASIYNALDGKKTYIVAGLGGVVFALEVLGYITPELAVQFYTILGLGGVATLRDAIRKVK